MPQELITETNHLKKINQELLAAQKVYSEALQSINATGQSVLKQFQEDTKLNFDSYLDNLDTFSMMEMKNREIDQLNIQMETFAKKLEKVEHLLPSPYFGKIDVTFLEMDSDHDSFYIGMTDFTNLEEQSRIFDWRSPIAALFYNNEIGTSSYIANQVEIPVDVTLKRQLIIKEKKLLNFFDTNLAIQDDVLLQSLEADSSQHMKDITTTIQQEQNEIIRDEKQPLLLVHGIAGSGKTSAIMQRIAYLLYQHRTEITADNILLLSPNSNFIEYISQVLPNLGERNPLNLTLLQFLVSLFQDRHDLETESTYFKRITAETQSTQEKIIQSADFVNFIKNFRETALIHTSLFRPIRFKKKVIFSVETIFSLYQKTPDTLSIRERLSATKEKLMSQWTHYLQKQATSKNMIDQIQNLTEAEQLRYFDRTLSDEDETQLAHLAFLRLQKKYAEMINKITDFTWFDQWGLFQLLYEKAQQIPYQKNETYYTVDEAVCLLLIKHTFVTDLTNRQMTFILVDEVQDYTSAQIALLLELFPQANFTFAGDENQAIFTTSIDFTNLQALLSQTKRSGAYYQLLNSYRSSKEITQLFQHLATNRHALMIRPIRKDGEVTRYLSCEDQLLYMNTLRTIISESSNEESLAIITKTTAEKELLTQQLFGLDPSLATMKNIQILSIDHAKGLEFDRVIVHDSSSVHYQNTDRNKKILYTSISRAMKQVILPYIGEISELLNF